MRILISIIIVVAGFGCNASLDLEVDHLPDCLQIVFENDYNADFPIQSIKEQRIGQDRHFWLDTDKIGSVWSEYILNEQCDSICAFCSECVFPECIKVYNEEQWVIIWER